VYAKSRNEGMTQRRATPNILDSLGQCGLGRKKGVFQCRSVEYANHATIRKTATCRDQGERVSREGHPLEVKKATHVRQEEADPQFFIKIVSRMALA
jgi:hypothetical protein